MHKPRKQFGQNFLVDSGTIDKIIRAFNPQITDHVIEIGSGQGALTTQLISKIKHLDAIEIDRDLIEPLNTACCGLGSYQIHPLDALKADLSLFSQGEKDLRVIGNLPYNISTPLLFHLLTFKNHIKDMCFMLQKEVVDRIQSGPNEKDYGRLSVMLQYACEVKRLFVVKPSVFRPRPKVDSAIIYIKPYDVLPHEARCFETFEFVVRQAFMSRRKMISNNLKRYLTKDDFNILQIDSTLRAENLSVADFVKISDFLKEKSYV